MIYLIWGVLFILTMLVSAAWFWDWFQKQRAKYLIVSQKRLAGNITEEEMEWWLRVKRHRYINLKEWVRFSTKAKTRKVQLIWRALRNVVVALYRVVYYKIRPKPKKIQVVPRFSSGNELKSTAPYISTFALDDSTEEEIVDETPKEEKKVQYALIPQHNDNNRKLNMGFESMKEDAHKLSKDARCALEDPYGKTKCETPFTAGGFKTEAEILAEIPENEQEVHESKNI